MSDKAATQTVAQRTLEEIAASERLLVIEAGTTYGLFFETAKVSTILLSTFVKSIDPDRMIFGRLLTQIKKHHTLALLSTVRRHQVQAHMNLRQVIEAGALAAYAIANPEVEKFVAPDKQGFLNSSKTLTVKAYKWLDQNYAAGSKALEVKKKLINESTAHANLINSNNTFEIADDWSWMSAPFFDIEDDYVIRTDLYRVADIAVALLDLFFGVNQSYGSVKFVDDFVPRFEELVSVVQSLHAEMISHERYKRAEAMVAMRASQ